MRVATVVGTRPEIIRLSRVIPKLDRYFEHTLIHTGQNYDHELNTVFFEEMSIREPDYSLRAVKPQATTVGAIGAMMAKLEIVFDEVKPEAVLILGDTNSCLAAAYVAKRKKIPLFHMEAGNRTFDQRVPEEVNRVMIDHISDINLPYSSISRENLLREGLSSDRIIKTGSPMKEVLGYYHAQITESTILRKLGLSSQEYFVVSSHREENVDSRTPEFLTLLLALAEEYHRPLVVSAHPRLRKKLEGCVLCPAIKVYKPFGFFDYIALQKSAKVTLSDSGTITEESSILGFPALNLRESHERPEGMEEASVPLVGYSLDRIRTGIGLVENAFVRDIPEDYLIDNVSEKIPTIILSYTDYVNRNVWRKHV
jgi:UDP-N-acetylglucosamine 2-epimerase